MKCKIANLKSSQKRVMFEAINAINAAHARGILQTLHPMENHQLPRILRSICIPCTMRV